MRLSTLLLAGLIFTGCAAMAVRTGVRAVKTIDKKVEARETTEAGQDNAEQRPRLIHRPGLLIPEQGRTASNSLDQVEGQ